jgi:hypothetical protein
MIVNIETFTDADYRQAFAYVTAVTEDPISLVDETLRLMSRVHADDATALFECNEENGRIVKIDAGLGKFELIIPLSILSTLTPGEYVHSLIRHSSVTGLKRTIWRGRQVHAAGPTR